MLQISGIIFNSQNTLYHKCVVLIPYMTVIKKKICIIIHVQEINILYYTEILHNGVYFFLSRNIFI